MQQETFIDTFRRCFDYPETSNFTLNKIEQLQRQIDADQWSSKKVLDNFEALYSDLEGKDRNRISDIRQQLIELRDKERSQRKEARKSLERTLSSSLDPVSISANEFINVWLSHVNQEERHQIQEQLQDSLGDLKPSLYEDSFDADTFRCLYKRGDEDELQQKFLEFYQYLRHLGWHERDLREKARSLAMFYEDIDDTFDHIANLAKQDRTERTYVFFVSGVQVLEEVHGDDYVYAIVPPGNLGVDDLMNIYPYDDIDELDLYDSTGPPGEPTIAEMLEERTLIAFPIEAFGTFGGKSRALERLSEILDMFSFSHSLSQVKEPHFQDRAKYIIWQDDGESSCHPASLREPDWEATVFEWDINRIFGKMIPATNHHSSLSVKLKRGLHFYRKGNNSRRDVDTIIYYIACLETIAGVGRIYRDEIIETGLLLGKVRDSDMETFREALERIYDFRNEALHAGLRQVDTRGEVDLMRGILKSTLEELAEAINDEGVESMPEFLTYFQEKKHENYEYWRKRIEDDGFEVDKPYSFTGEMYNSDGALKGDVAGEIEFVEDGEFITRTLKIEELDKAEDFEFGEGLVIQADICGKSIVIQGIRENSLTTMTINQGSFSGTEPWRTIFKEYEIL